MFVFGVFISWFGDAFLVLRGHESHVSLLLEFLLSPLYSLVLVTTSEEGHYHKWEKKCE